MAKKIALYISIIVVVGVVGLLLVLSLTDVIQFSPFDFNVNVSVGNSPPVIEFVNFTNVGAFPGSVRQVLINFTVSDGNGAVNLNNTSARVEIYNLSLTPDIRVNDTCSAVGESGNSRNYTCEVGIWYFDPYGRYVVNVTIADNSGERAENSSRIFDYLYTAGFDVYPNGLIWPAISVSSINVNSSNDPLYANNTGNVNFTIVNLTAFDLPGKDFGAFIYAGNFSASVNDDCSGNILANNTGVVIIGGSLPIGNLSIGSGTAQEELYFCIKTINSGTPSDSYSTANTGGTAWEINLQE